jgi:AraC family transcriptional regulator
MSEFGRTRSPKRPAPANHREYERRVNRVVDHVQAHLAEDLTLERLAAVAAFSPFHFHRIFTAITGETLSEFVRRLRLERAASALALLPHMSVLDIALHHGFSSAATFARAFKSCFGMSATEWRAGGAERWRAARRESKESKAKRNPGQQERKRGKASSKHIRHSPSVGTKGTIMRVEVRQIPPYRVAYMRHVGPYGADGNIPALWTKFERWMGARDLLHPAAVTIGIGHDALDIVTPEKSRYDACLVVGDDFRPDISVNVTELPGGRYAVAFFEGTAATISDAWNSMFGTWLPGSGFQPDDRPCLELYHHAQPVKMVPGRFRCELCLPVKPLWRERQP